MNQSVFSDFQLPKLMHLQTTQSVQLEDLTYAHRRKGLCERGKCSGGEAQEQIVRILIN